MSITPFKVKAIYEYTSPHEDDLHFPNGQIITVVDEEDEDWYSGEYVDAEGVKQEGIFPRNFVEKYEPQAPPRPVRSARPKKEAEPAAQAPPEPAVKSEPAPAREPAVVAASVVVKQIAEPEPLKAEPLAPVVPKPVEEVLIAAPSAPKPAPVAAKSPPPPVVDKPSSGSFRDRIAAFNKATAPPPVPYKPGGAGDGSSFIRKPFVAPPPSKNAYIPPPRDVPIAKIYRREEDPEIAEREHENLENAERAGLAPTNQEGEGDQPKPTSLKERIALLQKQQAEQAARHADAAAKKEKPKRPTKKRTESQNATETQEGEEVPLEKQDSHDTIGRPSVDSSREEHVPQQPTRRKSSRGPPAVPAHAPEADGNDADMSGAGDETEEPDTGLEDSDTNTKMKAHAPPPPARAPVAPVRESDVGNEEGAVTEDEEDAENDEEEEEEEIDPEIRRKEEIRARMAKMSGGMGMHGMFGPPGGMPMPMPMATPVSATKKKKPSGASEKQHSGEYGYEDTSPTSSRAPPVPVMALPGMSKIRTPEEVNKQLAEEREGKTAIAGPITGAHDPEEVPDVEDIKPIAPVMRAERPVSKRVSMSQDSFSAPPIPEGRPAPPPVPSEARPHLPPLATPISPSAGPGSDAELSQATLDPSLQTPTGDAPPRPGPPPSLLSRDDRPISPKTARPTSYFGGEPGPTSPTSSIIQNKRASRVPPIPGAGTVVGSAQSRAPPPPPNPPVSRSSTGDSRIAPPVPQTQEEESEEEITEYEGDYDTDIASAAPHKDALKAHTKESSLDIESPVRSSYATSSGLPPPFPPVAPPRGIPPPLPSQPPRHARQSSDMPRAAPPPPPPARQEIFPQDEEDEEEYDPYKYTAPRSGIPVGAIPIGKVSPDYTEDNEEDLYSASPPRSHPIPHGERAIHPREVSLPPTPTERAAPPPPPHDFASSSASRVPPRQSVDVQRTQGSSRRSTDLSRMSMDHGFIANDVDMGESSLWWSQSNGVPPAFYGRKDILHEAEESTTSKRGGKSITTRDLYVLFPDYSQTIITVQFDPHSPSDASFEQRHEQPPSRLRPDQLEESHDRFGRRIYDAVMSKKDTVVGDGTPAGLILELLKPLPDALLPIGTRAYGALVYSNQGNSLTSQFDEIRPGDIITLRNAKFQGKHGPMHAKYTAEVGKGEGHVGVVAEWDGPKKKVRAWEQGRESKKVKQESFKLDDLRSGEVKIWRVMPRSWVGWEGQNSK